MNKLKLTDTVNSKQSIHSQQIQSFLRTSAQYLGLTEVSDRLPADYPRSLTEQTTLCRDPEHPGHCVQDH